MRKIKILNVLILAITLNFAHFVAGASAKDENKQKVIEKNVGNNEQEERYKIEEAKIKEVEKNVKEHEAIEKLEIEKNKRKYKNFKKEDYEVKGFNLEVYWKNGVPYLYYVHKKTKAQIVFILVEEEDLQYDFRTHNRIVDSVFFKVFSNDDSGLAHFAEHLLSNFINCFEDKYAKGYVFQASTEPHGLDFLCQSIFPENDLFFSKLYENLADEGILKDKNMFEIEKNRIIDEMQMKNITAVEDKIRRDFLCGGTVEDLKKVKFKDFRRFYEKYIHPSNMIIKKHVKLNKKNITGFLKVLENKYLNKFKFKKVTSNFKLKCSDKFRKIKVPAKHKMFVACDGKNNKNVKYSCSVAYDLDKLNINLEQAESLDIRFTEKIQNKLQNFIKKLGYDFCGCFYGDGYITGKHQYNVILNANDKNLFKKDVLKSNINKILEFIKNELSNVKEDEIQNLKPGFKYQEVPVKDQEDLVSKLSKSYIYSGYLDLNNLLSMSFAKYNEPFSPKVFYIDKNNEIIDSKENFVAKTKNNLNFYDVLINNDPLYIDLFESDENENKEEKNIEYEDYLLPIKIKDYKDNKMVYLLANEFICNKLGNFFSYKKGYCYSSKIGKGIYFPGDYIGKFLAINKESKNKIFKYLKEDFNNFIKNLKFTRKDFYGIIEKRKKFYSDKAFEEVLTVEKKYLKNVKDWLKAIDDFCKTGKTDGKLFNKYSLVKDIMNANSNMMCYLTEIENKCVYKNYEEYFKNEISGYKEQNIFIQDAIKQRNEKISKKFLKKYRKYVLKSLYNLSKCRIRCLKEDKKLIETVKYEDVSHAIKSAVYCEDEEYRKRVDWLIKFANAQTKS